MTNRLISFSRGFKQRYHYELDRSERAQIDKILSSMTPVLKTMKASDFHFSRIEVRFIVKGVGILHVPIHDNPLLAVAKKIDMFKLSDRSQ